MMDSRWYIPSVVQIKATPNHSMADVGVTRPWNTTALLWELMVYDLLNILNCVINNNNNNKVKLSNIFLLLPFWDD
jgi:hypothetical protein